MAAATAEIMARLRMARTPTLRFGQGRNSLRMKALLDLLAF